MYRDEQGRLIWKCAGKRFYDYESYIRFYYESMPELAEWLIEQRRKRTEQNEEKNNTATKGRHGNDSHRP